MKTHQQIRDWLPGYVLGDLDETQVRAVQSHVTQCPDCQAELAGLQHLLDLSRDRHALQADDALIQQAQQRLRQTLNAEPVAVMNPWRKIMTNPLTHIAAAAILLVSVLWMPRQSPQPEPIEPKGTTTSQHRDLEISLDETPAILFTRLQSSASPASLLAEQSPEQQMALVRYLANQPEATAQAWLTRIVEMDSVTSEARILAAQALTPVTSEPAEDNQNSTLAPEQETNPVSEEPTAESQMTLTLVDAQTGQSLAGVQCTVSFFSLNFNEKIVTDSQGRCVCPYEGQPVNGRIKFYQPGYAVLYVSHDSKTPWPMQQVIQMETGVAIGGIVTTESGEPIEDVEVKVSSNSVSASPVWYPYADTPDGKVRTDAEGRWQIKHFPSKAYETNIDLSHETFVSVYQYSTPASLEELKTGQFVTLMRAGHSIAGTVLNEAGEPIVGCKVYTGDFGSGSSSHTTTDVQGNFEFHNCETGSMQLLAQAPGYAQGFLEVKLTKAIHQADMVLEPESVLTVQVNDPNGKPIEGVTLRARSWQKDTRRQPAENIRVEAKTDKQGMAILRQLPPETIGYEIYKKGYANLWEYEMAASEQEHFITLYPVGKLKGHVYDQQTGALVEYFTCIEGIHWVGQDSPSWQTYNGEIECSDGKYELALRYHDHPMGVKIMAEGYEPYVSEFVWNEGRVVEQDVYLMRGQTLTGVVYEPNGMVSHSACLAIVTHYNLSVNNGQLPHNDDLRPVVEVDDQGRYRLAPQEGPFRILVVSEQGCVELSSEELEKECDIVLLPWGRVEGMVFSGNQPLARCSVNLSLDPNKPVDLDPDIRWNYSATTDENGFFSIERVRPGQVRISRMIPISQGARRYAMHADTEVVGGQTVSVEIGGGGRRVVGRFSLENLSEDLLQEARFFIEKDVVRPVYQVDLADCPPLSLPQEFFLMPSDERVAWMQEWSQGPEGKRFIQYIEEQEGQRTPHVDVGTYYAVQLLSGRAFEIDDILPGQYRLKGTCRVSQDDSVGELVAECDIAFEVPEIQTDADYGQVIDLGEVWIRPAGTVEPGLEVGDALSPLTLKNLRGDSRSWSQVSQGNWLLLDLTTFSLFGVLDEAPDLLPDLQDLYDQWSGTKGPLTIVSLGQAPGHRWEATARPVQYFLEQKKVSWEAMLCSLLTMTQGSYDFQQAFLSQGKMPLAVLVDPEQKVAAIIHDPQDLLREVNACLFGQ